MKSLQEFHYDNDTENNVREYLIQFLKDEAVKKIFNKEDVSAVAEAKEMIDRAFENLDNLFPLKPKKTEQINEAR